MIRRATMVLLAAGGIQSLYAQAPGIGAWESYTAMTSVRSIAVRSGTVLAATGGGMFSFRWGTETFERATNTNGLTTNDLTAVGLDTRGRTWVGASDGAVNVYDSAAGRWLLIDDIRLSNKIQRRIHRFRTHGDTVFVVSSFGVLVFRTSRWEFGDTYANFGFVTSPDVRDVVVAADTVWVATSLGMAAASLHAVNLSAPSSWTIYDTSEGLPSNDVRSLEAADDTLLVGTSGGLVIRSAGAFAPHISFNGASIKRIIKHQSGVSVLSVESGSVVVSEIGSVFGSRTSLPATSAFQSEDMARDKSTGTVWLTTTSAGAAWYDGSGWRTVQPNGPLSNQFLSLGVDDGGTVWAATGIDNGGRGFKRFNPSEDEGKRWRDFTALTHPVLVGNDYYKISIIHDGSVWVSSWGDGAVKIVADSIVRKIDTQSIPALGTTGAGSPLFTVTGSVVADLDGRLWFASYLTTSRMLSRLDDDTTFTYFQNGYTSGESRFTSVAIDRFGTKWLANSESMKKSATGLYYFNENMTLPGTQGTGGWGHVSQSTGLSDNIVLSIAVDLEGDVWVGTDLGVTIFNEPSDPRIRRSTSFPLREQTIQTIAVDALNNKWAGTKEGVFVVSPDGAQLLDQYTVANTNGKLLANDVRSIAIDHKNGIAYFGTEMGLNVLSIAAVQTSRTLERLALGPSPFVLPSTDPLTIRNLVPNATIKILQVNGVLVAEFAAQGGGRAFWDGRNASGDLVSSGTYLIVAFSDNGEQVTTGKVAVIRR